MENFEREISEVRDHHYLYRHVCRFSTQAFYSQDVKLLKRVMNIAKAALIRARAIKGNDRQLKPIQRMRKYNIEMYAIEKMIEQLRWKYEKIKC